jgi:hypothetical protein
MNFEGINTEEGWIPRGAAHKRRDFLGCRVKNICRGIPLGINIQEGSFRGGIEKKALQGINIEEWGLLKSFRRSVQKEIFSDLYKAFFRIV